MRLIYIHGPVRGWNPGGDEVFRTVQTVPGAHPASNIVGIESLSRW